MDNQHKEVNHNMVILGRESRGLSQKALAEKLGVTQGRISKIEMGLLPVPDDLLNKLSQILEYPTHFFFQEGSMIGVGIAEIFHRKRQDTPKKTLNKAYASIELKVKHLAKLLLAAEIPYNVPPFNITEYEGQAEKIAQLVRSIWNIPRGPIQDLTETIEDQGILIIPIDFETHHIDAISRWIPTLPPLFFVSKSIPKDRYRFSLAHELGHMIMHQYPNPDMEEQANRFASEFLLPEHDIRADLEGLNLAKLAVLKRYWKVSMTAILLRAEQLQIITPNRARYLWSQMSQAGYKVREPIELDVKGENPLLLYELIDTYRKELGYSITDLSYVLALNEDEFRSQYLDKPDKHPLRLMPNS